MLLKLEDYGYKVDATDPDYKRKQAILEEEGRIIRMPLSKEKLVAIYNLWITINPSNSQEAILCAQDAADIRATQLNKFGTSADPNSALRRSFTAPTSLLRTIEAFETEFMKGKTYQKDVRLFLNTFPKFKTAEAA